MKRLLVGALVLTFSTAAFPDDSVLLLLDRLPKPPGNACRLTGSERGDYRRAIDAVARDIDASLAKRQKAQKAYVKQNEEAWREQMMRQTGLTDEQIAKVKAAKNKRGKAGAAARRELAEEMLQQHADLSIDEARQLQDGKQPKGFVKGYVTQEIDIAQAQVQAGTPAEQEAAQKKQERLARLAALAKEQQDLMQQTGAGRDRLWNKIRDLEDEAQKAYEDNIGPIDERLENVRKAMEELKEEAQRLHEKQRAQREGNPGKAGDPLAVAQVEEDRQMEKKESVVREKLDQMLLEKDDALRTHCAKFTPRYCDLLSEYLIWAREAQGGFTRYEEMENEKFKLQTDNPDNKLSTQIGTLGLQEAKACVDLMRTAFKFVLQDLNRPLDGSKPPDIGAAP